MELSELCIIWLVTTGGSCGNVKRKTRVTSSNSRVRRIKARVARLKALAGRSKSTN